MLLLVVVTRDGRLWWFSVHDMLVRSSARGEASEANGDDDDAVATTTIMCHQASDLCQGSHSSRKFLGVSQLSAFATGTPMIAPPPVSASSSPPPRQSSWYTFLLVTGGSQLGAPQIVTFLHSTTTTGSASVKLVGATDVPQVDQEWSGSITATAFLSRDSLSERLRQSLWRRFCNAEDESAAKPRRQGWNDFAGIVLLGYSDGAARIALFSHNGDSTSLRRTSCTSARFLGWPQKLSYSSCSWSVLSFLPVTSKSADTGGATHISGIAWCTVGGDAVRLAEDLASHTTTRLSLTGAESWYRTPQPSSCLSKWVSVTSLHLPGGSGSSSAPLQTGGGSFTLAVRDDGISYLFDLSRSLGGRRYDSSSLCARVPIREDVALVLPLSTSKVLPTKHFLFVTAKGQMVVMELTREVCEDTLAFGNVSPALWKGPLSCLDSVTDGGENTRLIAKMMELERAEKRQKLGSTANVDGVGVSAIDRDTEESSLYAAQRVSKTFEEVAWYRHHTRNVLRRKVSTEFDGTMGRYCISVGDANLPNTIVDSALHGAISSGESVPSVRATRSIADGPRASSSRQVAYGGVAASTYPSVSELVLETPGEENSRATAFLSVCTRNAANPCTTADRMATASQSCLTFDFSAADCS